MDKENKSVNAFLEELNTLYPYTGNYGLSPKDLRVQHRFIMPKPIRELAQHRSGLIARRMTGEFSKENFWLSCGLVSFGEGRLVIALRDCIPKKEKVISNGYYRGQLDNDGRISFYTSFLECLDDGAKQIMEGAQSSALVGCWDHLEVRVTA